MFYLKISYWAFLTFVITIVHCLCVPVVKLDNWMKNRMIRIVADLEKLKQEEGLK